MEHFSDNLNGFFNFHELYEKVVSESNTNSHFVEVGSFLGKSSSFMCVEIINSGKNIRFDCIDPWVDIGVDGAYISEQFLNYLGCDTENCYEKDFFYNFFINNMQPVAGFFNPIKKTSIQASNLYTDNQLDFVFLDSYYQFESVTDQINAWWPKLKIGGIFGIHDYEYESIKNQVDACFDSNSLISFVGEKTNSGEGQQWETCYIKKESEDQLK